MECDFIMPHIKNGRYTLPGVSAILLNDKITDPGSGNLILSPGLNKILIKSVSE
jgi:hypothetical protein